MHTERILVVDEADASRIVLKVYFEGLDFEVDCARDEGEACAWLEHRAYDVVICDRSASSPGGLDGLGLVERLRERSPCTRTLMLSASGGEDVEREALARGVDLLLCKPQPLPELAHHVADLLRSAPPLLPSA